MGLLIGLLFRKILFWLLTTLGFSLVRMLFATGLKKPVHVQEKIKKEIVKIFAGLFVLAVIVGVAMLVVRIVIVVF